jgi:hypothetical protein
MTNVSDIIVSIATDGTYLYWAENGSHVGSSRIKRTPLGGGQVMDVVDGSLNGIAEDWEPVGGIAVDGRELFFASYGHGFIKVPVSGGSVTTLSGSGDFLSYETAPRKLVLDDATLYWIDGGTLKAMPRHGGNITALATGLGSPVALVIRDGYAIWAEDYCCERAFTGSIKMVPTTGGAAISVVSELEGVRSLDVDADTLYFIEGGYLFPGWETGRIAKAPIFEDFIATIVSAVGAGGPPLAVDNANAYFADPFALKKVSLEGGIVETLASNLITDDISALATDGQFVYWLTEGRHPKVRKIPVDGGLIEELVPFRNFRSYAGGKLVLESGFLYWTEVSNTVPPADAIMKVSVNGGPPVTVAAGIPGLGDFAVAGADLYFIQGGFPDTLRRISINGGPVSILAGVNNGSAIAADDNYAYWVNFFELGVVSDNGITQRWFNPFSGAITLAVDHGGVYWIEYPGNIVKVDRFSVLPLHLGIASLPDGEVNLPFNGNFQIRGGGPPYNIAVIRGALPPGLSLGSPVLQGTPSRAGNYSFTVRVTDQLGASVSKDFRIKIFNALAIPARGYHTGTVNRRYKLRLRATGGKGPYNWSLFSGTLAPGLTLNPRTGLITGTPSTPGTAELTFQVTDRLGGVARKSLTMTINSPSLLARARRDR